MGLPGWSLAEPTVLGDLTLFPRQFRWESDTVGLGEQSIVNETQRGVRYGYELFKRGVIPGLVFDLTRSEYDTFETFLDATTAGVIAFWFVPDSATVSTKYNVRREPCIPRATAPGRESGSLVQRFQLVLAMTVEVEDIEIED